MSDTPTLATLIQSFIGDSLLATNIAIPAIVRFYDASKREASVQPTINKDEDGGFDEYSIIQGVPVVMLGGKSAGITIPLQSGDMVLLVFSQKSMDAWMDSNTGEPSDPRDARVNNLQDAVAIPGIFPFSMAPNISGADDDLIIVNELGESNETKISLKKNGQIHLGDNGEFIAREGDPVEVTMPYTPVPAGGPPIPYTITGTITSGSSNNKSS